MTHHHDAHGRIGDSDRSRLGKELIGGLRELSDLLKRKESAGGGSAKFTCHTIVLDFQPTQYDAASVKKVRKLLGASQSIFARFLGVTAKTVQSWEQGQSTPCDMACRFLDEIRADRDYWLKRLRRMATPKRQPAER